MPPEPVHTPSCRANHMGLWAIEPGYLRRAVAAIKTGTWPVKDARTKEAPPKPEAPYLLTRDGIAMVPVMGSMMKGWSKFADVDTLEVRRAVRQAVADEAVRAILLQIDSPGGSAAGVSDLADDVRAADAVKPTYAYVEDLGASAAYWVASQARVLASNRTAEIGSIGVLAVVEDTSEAAAMDGITVHVVKTGAFKGAFVDGAPVPGEHLAYLQERVNDVFGHFLAAVEHGRGARGLTGERLRSVADGRVYGAAEAQRLGLVDQVLSLEAFVAGISATLARTDGERRAGEARARAARARAGSV